MLSCQPRLIKFCCSWVYLFSLSLEEHCGLGGLLWSWRNVVPLEEHRVPGGMLCFWRIVVWIHCVRVNGWNDKKKNTLNFTCTGCISPLEGTVSKVRLHHSSSWQKPVCLVCSRRLASVCIRHTRWRCWLLCTRYQWNQWSSGVQNWRTGQKSCWDTYHVQWQMAVINRTDGPESDEKFMVKDTISLDTSPWRQWWRVLGQWWVYWCWVSDRCFSVASEVDILVLGQWWCVLVLSWWWRV